MKRVVLREHERFYRGAGTVRSGTRQGGRLYLSELHYGLLQRLDENHPGSAVFRWQGSFAQSRQWVGIIQLPGLSIEILPKIAPRQTEDSTGFSRKNLLYMLHIAGALPLRERDLASQSVITAPLLETLIGRFAEQLLFEFQRGCQHDYLRRQENLPVLKGKLLFSSHLKQNLARRDRFFVEHDEFLPDTNLNRIFKAACKTLLDLTGSVTTADRLHSCLILLDQVATIEVQEHHFDRVVLNRQNERFTDLVTFARMVLLNQAPTASLGSTRTFSLLFDMDRVFEAFVAAFLKRYVLVGSLSRAKLFPQATGRLRHLARSQGKPTLPLKADLLLELGDQRLVIDTKWKRLSPQKGARQGIDRNDLYQLFAYTHIYETHHSVLLFPSPPELAEPQVFTLPRRHPALPEQQILAEFIDLHRDLFCDHLPLARELHAMLKRLLPEQVRHNLPTLAP